MAAEAGFTAHQGFSHDDRRVLAFAGEGLVELTLDGDRAALNYGGDAANAAVMCVRLGGPARLLGRVGADPLGRRLLRFWEASGIDTSTVVVDADAPTGLYVNEISDGRRRRDQPFTYWRQHSAGSRWSPSDVRDQPIWSGLAGLVFTGITGTVSATCAAAVWSLIEQARLRSVPVACILNYRSALSQDPQALERLAMSADVLIASTEDLASAFPTWSPVETFDLMQQPGHELVLTAGASGASVSWIEGTARQPAPAVPVRDTVGAGDALAGAYLCARFLRNQSPPESLAWGVAAASLSVQQAGCASSYPNADATAVARAQLSPASGSPTSIADASGNGDRSRKSARS